MLRINTEGTPYERGRTQGILTGNKASGFLERCIKRFDAVCGKDRQAELTRYETEILKEIHPAGYAETCGIADGMGMSREDYFRAVFSWKFTGGVTNCTTFAFRDEKGAVLIAKTDDIYADELGMNIIEEAIPDKGFRYTHLHFAGTIFTTAGMNEHGLCIAMTGIPGGRNTEKGLNSLDLLNTLLPVCADTKEAIALLRRHGVGYYGFSLMISDIDGTFALVEKNSAGMAEFDLTDQHFRAHTNHILNESLAAASRDVSCALGDNSYYRYENALRLGAGIPKTREGIISLITERKKYGIFQEGRDGLYTDYAVLFEPGIKRMDCFNASETGEILSETIYS